jgi:hypothetical protein
MQVLAASWAKRDMARRWQNGPRASAGSIATGAGLYRNGTSRQHVGGLDRQNKVDDGAAESRRDCPSRRIEAIPSRVAFYKHLLGCLELFSSLARAAPQHAQKLCLRIGCLSNSSCDHR